MRGGRRGSLKNQTWWVEESKRLNASQNGDRRTRMRTKADRKHAVSVSTLIRLVAEHVSVRRKTDKHTETE
ncbi:hypothetical protein K0M31_012412 [Melipona bicolor]|uniref:Uncharacterized protein n=1 Tax=Melipona bicolor TaxID=60889 RepID=A0AA40FKE1_9HYME|nr:hypothetical protein K0M31_012412 [Melipona bicolor]